MKKLLFAAALFVITPAFASFGEVAPTAQSGGPVAVGQSMAQPSPSTGKVAIVEAPHSGGVIQLAAFGWLEPYIDTAIQALIGAFFLWFSHTWLGQKLDQSSRDALETFAKNRASSLIADGAVKMENKTVKVNSALLYRAASESSTAIPDALKRFGLTPEVVAQKIIDAVPQTEAGAAIIATAHAADNTDPVVINDRPPAAPAATPAEA